MCAVGCGVIWRHHLQAVQSMEVPRLVYTAVAEPHAERRRRAAEATGARSFESLRAALEADPQQRLFEAVDIMVPNVGTLHEEVALLAQQHGRHVFLEKPISATGA